jgi:hypothetical protein
VSSNKFVFWFVKNHEWSWFVLHGRGSVGRFVASCISRASSCLESWADVDSLVLLVQPKKDVNRLTKISKKMAAGIAEQKMVVVKGEFGNLGGEEYHKFGFAGNLFLQGS